MSDIKVFCTLGMSTVLDAIVPAFTATSGIAVTRVYDSSVALMKRLAAGETADAAVFTAGALDELIASGRIVSRTDLAKSVVGIAVKAGAPQPDIATPDAFKRALLAAKSIGRSETGASGLYFGTLIERLGLAETLRPKIVIRDGVVGRMAASGEVEIAVQQISELMQAEGIDIVGPLPNALQSVTVFAAGVFSASQQQTAANTFVTYLASAAVAPTIRQKGMEPV